MKILENMSITDIPGFKACGIAAGIKKNGKKDLCVIYSEHSAVAAAAFTKNKVKAAPIYLDMEFIKSSNTQAIVCNAGNANASTGEVGLSNAYKMAEAIAKNLSLKTEEVLVSSTGVIGVQLPMEKVLSGIDVACNTLSADGGNDAAEAIMTTDTFPKKVSVATVIDGKEVLLSGIAKGSGMIHPNMGTMLGFVATNVSISKELLTTALKQSVEDSYNMVSVDGDTSTNDTVIVLANGAAGNAIISEEGADYETFKAALHTLNVELSKLIAKDGEGATKLIEVNLYNARTTEDAKICAKSIITSSLVKAAFFGSDANWGRIMCAIGYSGGEFEPDKVSIVFKNQVGEIQIAENGTGANFDEDFAKKILLHDYVNVIVDLHDGDKNAVAWGCDLTYDYVKINGDYRS